MLKKAIPLCLLLFVLILVGARAQQQGKITVSVTNVSLKNFCSKIQTDYGYSFMYSNTDVDDTQKISVHERSATIATVLTKAFAGKNIAFEIQSKKIILKAKKSDVTRHSSDGKVRGVVYDENHSPVVGASVSIAATTRGTFTDENGEFAIVATKGEELKISYIGYATQQIKIDDKDRYTINLAENNKHLDEVVVVGYGMMKKSDLTGALASVSTKRLTSKATADPSEALQGLAAGVNVTKNSGLAGDEISVKIRGVNTFGSSQPLYIIDGFEGDINSVNPNDIQSMEVLKDAAAAAIYGSTAANGVVLITTKQGSKGKIQVDVNAFITSTQTAKRLKMLDANGYVQVNKQMYDEYNRTATNPIDLPDYLSHPGANNTDWQDAIFRSGLSMNESVSVRGGMGDTRFGISENIAKDKGIVISNNYTKQNVRMKISTKKNIFHFDANMAYTAMKKQKPEFSLKEAYMMSPLVPVYDEKEPSGFGLADWGGLPDNVNVVAQDHFDQAWEKDQNFEGNGAITLDITKGLTFKTSYGIRGYNTQYYQHYAPYVADYKSPVLYPYYQEKRTYWQEQEFDNVLNYMRDFGKHSLNAMIGSSYTIQESNWSSVAVEGKTTNYGIQNGSIFPSEQSAGFLDPNFMTIGAGKGGTFSGDGTRFKYVRMSFFGRVNYAYDKRYLVQFTIRRDGSSKFDSDHRYGIFPSVAVGWRINDEKFFPKTPVVSNLKFRASWGRLGNEVALGYYDNQTLIHTYNSLALGYVQGQGANPWPGSIAQDLEQRTLRWETTDSKNIGFDFGFLNNKITGTINYYNNTTEDLLIQKRMAPSAGVSGAGEPVLNVGKLRNSGFELEVNYDDKFGDFTFGAGLNLSTLNNKVLKLADDDQILYGVGLKYGTEHFPNQTRVGHPIGGFYLYKDEGIFQSDEEARAYTHNGKMIQPNAKAGDLKFADTNGDGQIDEDDKVYCGSGMPKVEANLNLNFGYKNFDLTVLIGSAWGNKLYNGNRYFYEGMNGGSNFLASTLDAWRPDHTNTDIPRAVLQDPNGNTRESTRFLEDGDFIRIRQMQLGYTLPRNLIHALRSEKMRLYVSTENLATWTKYKGTDPEFSSQVLSTGVDRYIFPFTRSFIFGFQYTF